MFSAHKPMTRTQMLALCIALLLGLGLAGWWDAQQRTGEALRTDTLRLHIRADSDSVLDQTCKLAVRDAVLDLADRLCRDAGSAAGARAVVAAHLPDFQLAARNALARLGASGPVRGQSGEYVFRHHALPGLCPCLRAATTQCGWTSASPAPTAGTGGASSIRGCAARPAAATTIPPRPIWSAGNTSCGSGRWSCGSS